LGVEEAGGEAGKEEIRDRRGTSREIRRGEGSRHEGRRGVKEKARKGFAGAAEADAVRQKGAQGCGGIAYRKNEP